MKKRILGVLLATSVVATSFVGCGNESSSNTASAAASTEEAASPEEISGEITFVSANDQTGALDEMIESFNQVYPNVVVNHESLPGASDDIKESLMTSLAAGDSSPDVFECDIIWVSQFAAAGWLADVTDDIEPIKDQYLGGPLSTVYYNDRAYAYPDYTDVGLLYYRSDLIDTPPTT